MKSFRVINVPEYSWASLRAWLTERVGTYSYGGIWYAVYEDDGVSVYMNCRLTAMRCRLEFRYVGT